MSEIRIRAYGDIFCDPPTPESNRAAAERARRMDAWPDNAGTDDLGSFPAPLQVDVLLGNRDSAGWPVRDAAAAEEDE